MNIKDGDLGLGPWRTDDLEELARAVGLHVEGNDARHAAMTRRTIGDLQACAYAGELRVEEVRVHEGVDTTAEERVHEDTSKKRGGGSLHPHGRLLDSLGEDSGADRLATLPDGEVAPDVEGFD